MAKLRKVLVTGAGGFSGRWVVRHLVALGYEVHAGVRKDPGEIGVPWVILDLEDAPSVFSALNEVQPEGIVHLAGMASPHISNVRPEAAYNVNFLGAQRVLEACRVLGLRPRVVLAGSATVYGKVDPKNLPLSETAAVAPTDSYSVSKAAAEMLARIYLPHFPVVVARPFNHTGPGQGTDFALPAFAQQIALAECGAQPPSIRVGDLSAQRDFLDVRDVATAYAMLLEHGEAATVYNICSGTSHSIHHWLSELVRLSSIPIEIVVDPARVFPQANPILVGDNSRLRALGWSPRFGETELLSTLLDHWRKKTESP